MCSSYSKNLRVSPSTFPQTYKGKNSSEMRNLFWVKGSISGLRQFIATESPLKIMKNALNFMLLVSKLFLVMPENSLIRKLSLVSRFMMSQTGQQIITIHMFPNISRGKGNQSMKIGQLIEYNKNIFLQKSYRK